jgi:hypothetical protein
MTFTRALIVGDVPEGLLEAHRRAPPPGLLDRWGRAPVERILDFGLRAVPGDGPLLIVTGADLTMRECQWLLGYADVARQAVVVSTRRLADPGRPNALKARLMNEIAHEAGHLGGLRHCSSEACVMRPVTSAAELDGRPEFSCGACGPGPWSARLRLAAAALFLIAIVAGLNLLMPLIAGPRFEMPFT